MLGRISSIFDAEQEKIELARLRVIDSHSYRMLAEQYGRNLRVNDLKNRTRTRDKKIMYNIIDSTAYADKTEEHVDINNAKFDYIGELIIDTRNFDVDEENSGIIVLDSSIITLTGGIYKQLQYTDVLNQLNIPILLGIDKLDECEVDIGVVRYVFGFREVLNVCIELKVEPEENRTSNATLISKQKYEYTDEEYLDQLKE